jgi:hypothetical protein
VDSKKPQAEVRTVKDYRRIKEKYFAYLKAYKVLNNGSLSGATTFGAFYMRETYESIYNDPRIIALMSYN